MKMIRVKFCTIFTVFTILILCQTASAQLARNVIQLFEAVGARAGSKLGYQVAGLGDQNGDGFDDIITSAPGDRKVFIYFGGNPIDTIPDVIFHQEDEELFGYLLCNLEDVNGDSFDDFVIGSLAHLRVYWGGTELDTLADLILPPAPGRHICAAGDVNRDGYNDILTSDVNWQSSQGKATIYLGGVDPDSIADWLVFGDSARYYFGAGIAGNGDINDDGYDDIAISGWRQGEHRDYPYIKVFYGGAEVDTIPAFIIDSLADSLDIGLTTTFIDVNGDGLSDLCVDAAIEKAALIFHGPIVPDIILDLTLHGTSLSGKMWEISEAGDINDDGHPDIITGNYDGVGGLGEILVFLGGPHMDGEWDILINGFQGPYEGAGRSVGRAGDVNGDGVDDILFGAWREYGDNREGRVMIFSGDTTLTFVSRVPMEANKPSSVSLKQNYPNPFNDLTVIEYHISAIPPTRTVMKIYNVLGELVVTLLDATQNSGCYQVVWDGKDRFGTEVGTGIYFYRLQVGTYQQTRKLLLIR